LENRAHRAWVVIPCLLASIALASTVPAAEIQRNLTDDDPAQSGATTPIETPAPRVTAAVPGVPLLNHVIIVVMENHSYTQVKGLPYTASLISKYTSFSQSYAVSHPSEPNYLALWAASTLGLSDDSCPPSGGPFSNANLGHSCEAAGLTWESYCENLPSVGSTACSSSDNLYKRKHHPCPDFTNLNHSNECPFTHFATDVAAGKLPALSFVAPNMCNDTHDCSTTTGDNWLASHIPAMISAVGPRGLVIITWDEDDKSSGNHILTVFAGPAVKTNYVCTATVNHYTVVRVICDVLGLAPFSNAASKTTPIDIWNPASVTAVESRTIAGLSLGDPSPNPFHTAMTASLRLPAESLVRAFVVDDSGRRVRNLFAEQRSATSQITWDGSRDDGGRAAPGLYFLYVRAGREQLVRKLALTR
jgi:phosphoesterase family protein